MFDNWAEDGGFTGRFDNPYDNSEFGSEYTFACCNIESSQFDYDAPFDYTSDPAYIAVQTQARADAHDEVLARAGAWPRDIITRTAIDEVVARNGAIRNFIPSDFMAGLTPGSAPTDTDDDGMPDEWENSHGFDPNVDDHNAVQPSGYTAIEVYINELADSLVGSGS